MIDDYGRRIYDSQDIIDLLLTDPKVNLNQLMVQGIDTAGLSAMLDPSPMLINYQPLDISVREYDQMNQSNWFMPEDYKNLDIAAWVLDQCQTQEQLQRCGQELLLFQERNLFDLLKYLKFLIDQLKANNIIWGVGRGSSVASYVLFIIGVHKIDSMFYDLDIREFLR